MCGYWIASFSLALHVVIKDVIISHLCSGMSLLAHLTPNGQVSLNCKFTSQLAPDDTLSGVLGLRSGIKTFSIVFICPSSLETIGRSTPIAYVIFCVWDVIT